MDTPDILIAHPNAESAFDIRRRLLAKGLSVADPVASLDDVSLVSGALLLAHSSVLPERTIRAVPVVVIAPEDYAGCGPDWCPEGVITEPFRGRELENGVELVLRRLSQDPNRAVVHAMRNYALYLVEPDGTIATWNPGAVAVHGHETKQIVGQHVSVLYTEEDRASGVPDNELKLADREGVADDTRWLLKKNGERFWAEGLTTAVRDRSGELRAYAKITRDATERRKLESQLERSNDELQRFAYTVSHDLQEPLRTIRSYAELLQRRYKGKLDEDADEFIHFMVDAAGRMTQLLKDLLAYSQAGRPDRTTPEPTQSANILQWAMMNVDRLVKESGATITYDPLPMVEADQTQLSQVFQNLLGNAIKYRSKEPPKIHVGAVRKGDFYEFCVSDNGLGVAPEHHDRIFGVFKRLHGKEVPGTGIGLAICRKIIESHGGRIWVESEPSRGSTFRFTLRAHE